MGKIHDAVRREPPLWRRAAPLLVLALSLPASAQSTTAVAYPKDYKTNLVKYAVVDRSDGLSRDLYASRNAVDAIRRNPQIKEFPVGALFALDVHSAKLLRRDGKTRADL